MAKDETTIDRDGKPTVTASIEGKGRTVRFEVLGPVRVVDTSGGVPTLSEQRRTLLAVLIARANRDASTDLLTEALWGDRPP